MERRSIQFEYIRPGKGQTTFSGSLLECTSEWLVLTHQVFPADPVTIGGKDVLAAGSHTTWFLYKGEPYDIGRFYLPDGTWTGYYIDILEPVHWTGADASTLEPLVDLALDVWIDREGNVEILDEDELKAAVEGGHITAEGLRDAQAALEHVLGEIDAGTMPAPAVWNFSKDRAAWEEYFLPQT